MRRWMAVTLVVIVIGAGIGVGVYVSTSRRARCWDDARRECGERCSPSLDDAVRDAPPDLRTATAAGLDPRRGSEAGVDADVALGFTVGAMLDPTTRACVDACSGRIAARNDCGSDPG